MIRCLALLGLGLLPGLAQADLDLTAPNPGAKPIDQLLISGNACGPAALLTALDAGSPGWREVAAAVPAKDDRSRLSYLIRAHCLHPSQHFENRLRWDRKNGISLVDLVDVASELRGNRLLPRLNSEVLVLTKRETPAKLLKRTHAALAKSLRKGFPPVVSLRRMARPKSGEAPWHAVHGHFVVVVALPSKLERGATSFPVRYADPWGGRILEGSFGLEANIPYPSLLADVPASTFGADKVKSGETSLVSLSGCDWRILIFRPLLTISPPAPEVTDRSPRPDSQSRFP